MLCQRERKIVVLGHRGMLGQMASRYFADRFCEVVTIPFRYERETRQEFVAEVSGHAGAVVLNCIGRIKQKSDDVNELLWANAVLPLDLANGLQPDQIIVQPSTDCVFSGVAGRPYAVDDNPDATDDYGWSKRLGEVALFGRPNTLILRVSIIGPDRSSTSKGLLGWFLSQPRGSKLNGYIDHLWNGITTLEWCRQLDAWLGTRSPGDEPCRLLQLGTGESYSKYELLKLFQEVYKTDFQIDEHATGTRVDRRLEPQVVCKPLPLQLTELTACPYV